MKIYNPVTKMTPELQEKLKEYREQRAFNTSQWIQQKITLINEYFTSNKLTAAVVGVSGGLDSSVALGLLAEAQKHPQSPLKKIIPLLLPANNYDGATNQTNAITQANELCQQLNLIPRQFTQLTTIANIITQDLENILDEPSTPWARGQLVAYTRTPVLYNTTSILTDAGYPAIVIGTTNLSEGGYLGYVGKASDGMVDLQIISDLYKSEVYAVAEKLNLPASILHAIPTGDMYDGRDDEEVFGASYDFVELHHMWMQNNSDPAMLKNLVFAEAATNLENLHRYNQHKYSYSTPSIHLDIMNAHIPSGWNNTPWRKNGN